MEHFVEETQIKDYVVQNIPLTLEINKHIFPPSKHGSLISDNVKIRPRENVIDIGTGSGIIAIYAAKKGANVFATDIDNDAIETTKRNARRNNVNIQCSVGSFFAEFQRKFDIIIANLPQEIVPKDYQKIIGKQLTRSMDGGKEGNEVLLKFLDTAKDFMHEKTKLYVPVYTVSDYKTTFQKIINNYDAKLIAFDSRPTKEFVGVYKEFFLKLKEEGKAYLYFKNGQWFADIYLFELKLKRDA
jgi:release factor glutamine methyltransferase